MARRELDDAARLRADGRGIRPRRQLVGRLEAVFFDIGGVLELTPSTGWVERWEERLDLAPGGLRAAAHDVFAAGSIGAIGEEDVDVQLAHALRVDLSVVAALMEDVWAEYLGTPNAELIKYAASLRARCKVGLISNSFVGAREREQQRYGFAEIADDIVYSHEVGVLKPDLAIYQLACERLDVEPAAAAFIDDHADAVAGARRAGMVGLLFENNAQIIRELDGLV